MAELEPPIAMSSPVGALCARLPDYVKHPPIETVVFAWGVNEDRQLGLDLVRDTPTPKVSVRVCAHAHTGGRAIGALRDQSHAQGHAPPHALPPPCPTGG